MTVPVLTFFNNKGGVGKTSLAYHLAWMFAELGKRTFIVDLDPQANLTAAFLKEHELASLWDDRADSGATVYSCVKPLSRTSDLKEPKAKDIHEHLMLLPGDLRLSRFEDTLAEEWRNCFDQDPYRAMRVTSAFWQIVQSGAEAHGSDLVVMDVGPSLAALNRSAMIATDFIVVPLAADLFSRQGLRNLGPTLQLWREEWRKRVAHWSDPDFALPEGRMEPLGYLVHQHGVRLGRPVKAYDQWVRLIPSEYARHILNVSTHDRRWSVGNDENCIATVKHYRSLIPLGQTAGKPIFSLTPADGAIGAHATAAIEAGKDFRSLAGKILDRIESANKTDDGGPSGSGAQQQVGAAVDSATPPL